MKNIREEWPEPSPKNQPPEKNHSELQKKSEINDTDDATPKRPRRKNASDSGSRWIAPILLVVTVILSLLFQLFKQK